MITAKCVRCHSGDTDTDISTSYNGSALLQLQVTIDCNECDVKRSYATSLHHIRE